MINVTATVSLLELIWVLIGTSGVTVHVSLFLRYLTDKRLVIKYKGTKQEEFTANSGLRAQGLYALVQLGMLFIGINAMLIPPVTYVPTINSTLGAVFFIAIEVLLIVNGVLDHHDKDVSLKITGEQNVT